MSIPYCTCRTAALRIFMRSLVGPLSSTRRQWRSLTTSGRQASLDTVGRARAAGMTRASIHTQLWSTVVPAQRSIHSSRPRYNALQSAADVTAAVDNAESSSPPATGPVPETSSGAVGSSSEPIVPIDTGVVSVGEGQAPPQLGKNKRKKLRRQREKDEAEAAARAAGKTGVESTTATATATATASETTISAPSDSAPQKEARANEDVEASDMAPEPMKKKDRKRRKEKKEKQAPETAKADGQPTAAPPVSTGQVQDRPLPPDAEPWQIQKRALREKFPEGWNPRKKLSPDALDGIRALHRQFPETYTTPVLARHFQVSPEAIRRILKSRWQASPEEEEARQQRWFARGKQVWSRWAALGRKPPKRWQAEGIRRDTSWTGRRRRLQQWREQEQALERLERGQAAADENHGEAGGRLANGAEGERNGNTSTATTLAPPASRAPQTQSQGKRVRLLRVRRNSSGTARE